MVRVDEIEHSPVGPSSFVRVENCSASAILGEGLEPVPATMWAAEGTVAHKVLEMCLQDEMLPFEFLGETFEVGEHKIDVDDEMVGHLDTCMRRLRGRLADFERVEYEVRLQIPGTRMFGTADILAMREGWPVHIWDLKFGAGIEVAGAIDQLGIYGLMAFMEDGRDLHTGAMDEVLVVTEVMQPRGRSGAPFKQHKWTREALIALEGRIRRVLETLRARRVHYDAGEHCRFCSAAGVCPHLRNLAKDAAMAKAVTDPEVLDKTAFTAEELDKALRILPALDRFKAAILGQARQYLEHGGYLEEVKLVLSRQQRVWKDESKAQAFMEANDVDPWQPSKLLSPAMAEKKLPKALKPQTWAGDATLVEKTPAKETIAMRDDSRTAIVPATARLAAAKEAIDAQRMLNKAPPAIQKPNRLTDKQGEG